MTKSFVMNWAATGDNTMAKKIAAAVGGALFIAATAQIAIPLPFTPVPITGQTFGVALAALLLGRNVGGASAALYLAVGAIGFPVYALGASFASLGPSAGYLFGMLLSSLLVGFLADRGWTRSFGRAYAACAIGSLATFACGLLVLSRFVPSESLLVAGLLPFLPGDAIKSALAAGVASRARRGI